MQGAPGCIPRLLQGTPKPRTSSRITDFKTSPAVSDHTPSPHQALNLACRSETPGGLWSPTHIQARPRPTNQSPGQADTSIVTAFQLVLWPVRMAQPQGPGPGVQINHCPHEVVEGAGQRATGPGHSRRTAGSPGSLVERSTRAGVSAWVAVSLQDAGATEATQTDKKRRARSSPPPLQPQSTQLRKARGPGSQSGGVFVHCDLACRSRNTWGAWKLTDAQANRVRV